MIAIKELYKELPLDILKKGYSLEQLGIGEIAWRKDEIISIIKILNKNNIPVLGGDVYKIINDKIEITYDNWYMNNDGNSDFVERSLIKVVSYIGEYESANGNNFVYTLVF